MERMRPTPEERDAVLLTGGTEGIGRSTVEQFLRYDPAHRYLLTCSRTEAKNEELGQRSPERLKALTLDLGETEGVDDLVEAANEQRVDTLILNAGITGIPEADQQVHTTEYIRGVNEEAPIRIIEKMLPSLRQRPSLVLFVSSPAVDAKGPEGETLYAQTKRKVEQTLHELAQEEENRSVQFIAVRPGSVATRLHERMLESGHAESPFYQRSAALGNAGQLRDPAVIGNIFLRIATERALFNPETQAYNRKIESGGTHDISEEEYQYVKNSLEQG